MLGEVNYRFIYKVSTPNCMEPSRFSIIQFRIVLKITHCMPKLRVRNWVWSHWNKPHEIVVLIPIPILGVPYFAHNH